MYFYQTCSVHASCAGIIVSSFPGREEKGTGCNHTSVKLSVTDGNTREKRIACMKDDDNTKHLTKLQKKYVE